MDAIVVGLGFASLNHWIPTIKDTPYFELIGGIDPVEDQQKKAKLQCPGIWTAASAQDIRGVNPDETAVFVVTPDHYPTIVEFAEYGFTNFIVEKPLVNRDHEVTTLQELITKKNLRIYAVDHYYQKFLALEFVLGNIRTEDPRVDALDTKDNHRLEQLRRCLGGIEGVTYANLEAKELGIPYLNDHPWLEYDPEIGGVIRDLGPHAFAPLTRMGFLGPNPNLYDIQLLRLTEDRAHFTPVHSKHEVEMYVHTVLTYKGVTSNITFCKAPFEGKERSLSVRASNGTFHAGLARGQSGVVMTNDGRTTRLSLRKSENELVIEEAKLFFEGKLPGFDGNLNAAITALKIGQGLRNSYFSILR